MIDGTVTWYFSRYFLRVMAIATKSNRATYHGVTEFRSKLCICRVAFLEFAYSIFALIAYRTGVLTFKCHRVPNFVVFTYTLTAN